MLFITYYYIMFNHCWIGITDTGSFVAFSVSEGSSWTSRPARPTRPLWHSWVRRHWCEYPRRLAQQVFSTKILIVQKEDRMWRCSAVLQSHQQRAPQMKTHGHKRALFPLERGVFERGPFARSEICATVMWYMWAIQSVNNRQVLWMWLK